MSLFDYYKEVRTEQPYMSPANAKRWANARLLRDTLLAMKEPPMGLDPGELETCLILRNERGVTGITSFPDLGLTGTARVIFHKDEDASIADRCNVELRHEQPDWDSPTGWGHGGLRYGEYWDPDTGWRIDTGETATSLLPYAPKGLSRANRWRWMEDMQRARVDEVLERLRADRGDGDCGCAYIGIEVILSVGDEDYSESLWGIDAPLDLKQRGALDYIYEVIAELADEVESRAEEALAA